MFQKHSAYIFTVGVKSLPYDLFNGLMALKTEFYSLTFTYSYFEVLTSNQYDVHCTLYSATFNPFYYGARVAQTRIHFQKSQGPLKNKKL